MFTYILIKKVDSSYIGWSKAKNEPTCGDTENFEWIDYRENIGTEDEPVYQGRDLPDDIDTETIDPDTGEITTPVYIWDGKDLIRETMDI